ncbi:histidine kinase dimerization/phosphoacceptor domain -containing protein [uncultured Jannaschia sp.]|uniref:histidine kinase dimerization/phosphoacceptor domain -containing protein n=1 Tax=uncultured Jannaschia sp. TaxID=293347 RepID=UPI0026326C87|nr:histidine kinase dimerization/phosphoacceptor domain -containing protein [uncultured Jannaschia sp.]
MLAQKPINQPERLAALRRYELDTHSNRGAFEGIVELAAQTCHCPVAMVSIVHADDQRFETRCGIAFDGTGLESSICSHAILQDEILEIPDTRLDMRTQDNPLVTDPDAPMLFYAGAQIKTRTGVVLGTLCVLDHRPRRLGDSERRALRILADQVMQRLELHEALRQQDAMRREVDHRVKNSLAGVAAMTRMTARRASEEVRAALLEVEQRINVMVELHSDLYQADNPDAPIEISNYLRRVVSYLENIAPPNIEIDVDLEPLELLNKRASALGVLVNELISNACKHAFPDGRTGRVVLHGTAEGDGRYRLSCEDDGVGSANAGAGLGQRIMEASASQLDGYLHVAAMERGHRVELEFPLDAR